MKKGKKKGDMYVRMEIEIPRTKGIEIEKAIEVIDMSYE
jgi:hypothetical protein